MPTVDVSKIPAGSVLRRRTKPWPPACRRGSSHNWTALRRFMACSRCGRVSGHPAITVDTTVDGWLILGEEALAGLLPESWEVLTVDRSNTGTWVVFSNVHDARGFTVGRTNARYFPDAAAAHGAAVRAQARYDRPDRPVELRVTNAAQVALDAAAQAGEPA
jgi:hypothetical protein